MHFPIKGVTIVSLFFSPVPTSHPSMSARWSHVLSNHMEYYHPHRVPGRERRTIVLKNECGSDAKQTKDSSVVCRASVVNSQLYYVSRMLIGTSHDDKEGSLLSWEIPLSFSVARKKRTLFSGKTTHLKDNLPWTTKRVLYRHGRFLSLSASNERNEPCFPGRRHPLSLSRPDHRLFLVFRTDRSRN